MGKFEEFQKNGMDAETLDVKVTDKKYVRYKEGAQRYSMGLHTFQDLAKEANAIIKLRKVVLVNTQIFEEYLETFREQ